MSGPPPVAWILPEPSADRRGGPEPTAGRRVVTSPAALPAAPYDLTGRGFVVTTIVSPHTSQSDLFVAAARGVDLVLGLALDDRERRSFLDQLRRVADVRSCPPDIRAPANLSPGHVDLLVQLAAGAGVEAAGRTLGLSRRTAYRRLGEIAAALGAESATDAVRLAREQGALPR